MDAIRFCAHAHTSTTVTGRFDREHGLEYNIMVYIIYIHTHIYIYIYIWKIQGNMMNINFYNIIVYKFM